MNAQERLVDLDAAIAAWGYGVGGWPEVFVNSETGRPYEPHHADEGGFVYSDSPRYTLAKGGEGGGKSVAGIVKDLNRLRRGMTGVMVSPDFEHFKKSLWPEFRRWCPVKCVVEKDRYRLKADWEATRPFEMHFISEDGRITTLYCGGIEDPTGWEGPNIHFAHFDEARRKGDAAALKVLAGRVRLRGPKGEPPQVYLTTTPKKHWLFDYFGPVKTDEPDPNENFKRSSLVVTLRTSDNAENLDPDYERERRSVLTETEARVLMDAEWEDIDDTSRFLPSITLWDACYEDLPRLDRSIPLYVAADGAYAAHGDVFGLVAVSRHPSREDAVAVRDLRAWEATGKPRDFDDIEEEIKQFCLTWAVSEIAYDPRELHHMMTSLKKPSKTRDGKFFPGVNTIEFKQGADREIADKQLSDLIFSRRVAHHGELKLRQHLENADKKTAEGKRLRIVKRSESLKIDLAVCLSMASARFVSGELGSQDQTLYVFRRRDA